MNRDVMSLGDQNDKLRAENATLRAALEAHGKEAAKPIAWLSQAHVLCSDLGVAPGHIEDRLFEAIGNAATLMTQRDFLLAAAINLREVKGRHHSEQAFNRLMAVVSAITNGTEVAA